MWKEYLNIVLDSEVTVWILGVTDLILLIVAIVSIIRSEKSTYDFEKIKSKFRNK